LFTGRIAPRRGEHFLYPWEFLPHPGGLKHTTVDWNIPIPDSAHEFAAARLPGDAPTLLVSPCSSHRLRNWLPDRYAAVMDHAATRGWRVVLCGGPGTFEREFGDAILNQCKHAPIDLVGKDTLKQFLALCRRASLVLTPDSGPMHMANAVGTKVLGLHAPSNPDRSGPYSDRRWCANRYDDAARKFRGKPAAALPWGTKLEYPGVMELIAVDDVVERFEAFTAST
jgi:heptosyltransferase I